MECSCAFFATPGSGEVFAVADVDIWLFGRKVFGFIPYQIVLNTTMETLVLTPIGQAKSFFSYGPGFPHGAFAAYLGPARIACYCNLYFGYFTQLLSITDKLGLYSAVGPMGEGSVEFRKAGVLMLEEPVVLVVPEVPVIGRGEVPVLLGVEAVVLCYRNPLRFHLLEASLNLFVH